MTSVLARDFTVVVSKKSAKPYTYGGVAIDEDEIGRKPRKPRGPKRAATDTRTEYRLARPDGQFFTGPRHQWPTEGEPEFNKAGQKWASLNRALQIWADYNIARSVQRAGWPDLHLEAFEITIKTLPPPQDQPVDTTKVALWYGRFPRYDQTLNRALALIKDGYDFKYLMEYRGNGDELPSHLKMRLLVTEHSSYSASGLSSRENYVSVAFQNETDMVFARMALGDQIDLIVTDEAVTIFQTHRSS